MLKKDIYYNNLISLLDEVVSSTQVDQYFDTLTTEVEQEEFASLVIEGLQREILALKTNHTKEEHYGNYVGLLQILENIETKFAGFVIPRKKEIQFIIHSIEHISNQIPDLSGNIPLNVADFSLVNLDNVLDNLSINYFHYYNIGSTKDSLFFINLDQGRTISSQLNSSPPNINLLFILLSKIGLNGSSLTGKYYVLIKADQSAKPLNIKSTLLLHIVSEGKYYYEPVRYTQITRNKWQSQIKAEQQYQQFLDTINIISEYNYSDEILNKYLYLYHIVEDFMYKRSLVTLERNNGGNFFSIRDFKRMYEAVSDKEYDTLHNFIIEVFKLEYSPGVTFQSFVLTSLNNFTAFGLSVNDVNELFRLFRIKSPRTGNIYTTTDIRVENISKIFAQLIYHIRNSIVHNKTTEFHLTYASLNTTILALLECFIMPSLESCIFYLTAEPSSTLVRFSNPRLKLWEE